MDHLKTLHNEYKWDLKKLQTKFGISHSAVLRILRSKFEPTDEVRQRQDKKAMEMKQERRKENMKRWIEKSNTNFEHNTESETVQKHVT